jgi:hypothetical protein
MEQQSCDGRGALSAFLRLISLKRLVSAALPKPCSNKIKPLRSEEETGNAGFLTLLKVAAYTLRIFSCKFSK